MIPRLFTVAILVLGAVGLASAAEIAVPPGDGTLSAAVAAATDGDVLLLGEGTFSGAVTIDKSLTVRPVNAATDAVVTDVVTIEGNAISVTVQKLKFTNWLIPLQAADVQILENVWTNESIDTSVYQSSEGDGSLVIVGNQIANGSLDIRSEDAYVAGNRLLNGAITSYTSAWIVGNEISKSVNAISASGIATVRIIGNRATCRAIPQTTCIDAQAALNLVIANVVEVGPTTYYSHYGIRAFGSGHSVVVNNVVRGVELAGGGREPD